MEKHNVLWIEFIRFLATFSVVWLHSAAPLLYKYNELSIIDWWTGNIYDSMVRTCVPLFFMLSGYLLLDKSETLGNFFAKRINKVLVPLVVWSIFYILWKRYYENGEPLSFYSFYSLLLTPAYYHLWFFYAIIGLYLYVPILRIFVQNSKITILYYFIVLWFFAVSIIPFIEKETHVNSIIDLKMISGYVGYLVIGHVLGKIKINKKILMLSFLVAFLSFLVTIIATYFFTAQNGGIFYDYFYEYLSPNIILMSVAVFILLKYISEEFSVFENYTVRKVIQTLSSASLGTYLVHTMVIFVLQKGDLGFTLSPFSTAAIYSVPLTAITTFFLSFLIIFVLQKIPLLNKCVP